MTVTMWKTFSLIYWSYLPYRSASYFVIESNKLNKCYLPYLHDGMWISVSNLTTLSLLCPLHHRLTQTRARRWTRRRMCWRATPAACSSNARVIVSTDRDLNIKIVVIVMGHNCAAPRCRTKTTAAVTECSVEMRRHCSSMQMNVRVRRLFILNLSLCKMGFLLLK